MATAHNFLRDWRTKATRPLWDSPLGARVRFIERQMLEPALQRLRGETVVWIGHDAASVRQLNSRIVKLPIYLTPPTEGMPVAGEATPASAARTSACLAKLSISRVSAELDQLPFQSGTVDGVVLHHSLEEHTDPRLILREVFRVLAPGGQLLVCGFNPWSLMGLRRAYARLMPDVMSTQRLINPIRLFDWFTLLGFELNAPPLYAGLSLLRNKASVAVAKPTHQLPFGGLVVTSATKQTNAFTFRSQRQVRSPQLAPVAYPRFASWSDRELPDSQTPQT